ncbi:MAG TPA: DUF167 domain-containing protein [Candidatus Desulfobacillus sp.]|nr:DUF167 domain-containing protein [Candidatus Desulfobacillus sp.]
MNPPWMHRESGGGILLSLHVQPGAKKTEIAGRHGEALKVRLAAAPVDGNANACLVGFVANLLGVRRTDVELVGGATARLKRLRVTGASDEALAALVRRAD